MACQAPALRLAAMLRRQLAGGREMRRFAHSSYASSTIVCSIVDAVYPAFLATIEYISGRLGASGDSTQRRSSSRTISLNG